MTLRLSISHYQRLREQPLWKLLAADHAPQFIGLLRHLLLESERRLPASVLFERLQLQLDILNAEHLSTELPRTAPAYVAYWLNQGWLERRLPEAAQEEEYELSRQAIEAIRWVAALDTRSHAATESRLALVIQQVVQLAEHTEANPETRLNDLYEQRKRIDAEIAAVQQGQVAALEGQRALERTRDIIRLAEELTEDFRRVREDFEQLNRQFRERIIDDAEERGAVLQTLFEGVDIISESEAGRTFNAFWALLNNMEQSQQLDNALDTVLNRGFSHQLERPERFFLRNLTSTLLQRGGQVHDAIQYFARSLRGFVQSKGYLEQRRLNQLLKQAQSEALQRRDDLPPHRATGYVLPLSNSRLRSISQWRLHDPRYQQVETTMTTNQNAAITLESVSDLVAQSEIDMRQIKLDIYELLASYSKLSITQALQQRPANQGLGTVIGYLSLGTRYGVIAANTFETVEWQGADGVMRRARIPLVWFLQEKRHVLV